MTDFFKPKPPVPPGNVRIIKTKATEMEFAWDPPPRPPNFPNGEMYIHGYEIYYQVEDAQPKRRLLDGFTTSFLIRGLGPGMLVHGISVKARSEGGWGVSSLPPISGRTSSAPPGQVDWIEVEELEAFSAALKWSKPRIENGAPVQNYKVQVYQPGVPGSAVEMETKSSNTTYVVWALKPGTAYMFTVCAHNQAGWGSWVSLPAYGLTLAAPPNEPTDLYIMRSTVDSVQLSWKIPFGNGADVNGYEVVYEDERTKQCSVMIPEEGMEGTPEEPLYPDEYRCVLKNLPSGSLLFQMQVRARNLAGWSAFSQPPLTATTSGKLVAWGLNGSGQLGWDDLATPNQFGNVDHMYDQVVTQVACGNGHTAVLSNGKVYTWGLNDNGQLGRFAGEYAVTRGIIDIKGFMAIQTGSGVESTNDEIFMYPNLPIHRQDGPVDYLGSLGPIEKTAGECVSIACGAKHTLALTDRGEIFVFGDGTEGVLGQGDEVSWPMPKLVDYLATPGFFVEKIWCGDQYCACTVQYGQGLTWGSGLYGQLGHCSLKNERYPRKVEYLAAHHITEICCGHRHTIFITDKGEAFSCGEGVDGKLGHGDEESLQFPKLIQSLKGVKTGACGRHHSCAILSDNTLFTFGSGTRGQLGYSNSEAAAVGNPIFPTLGTNTFGAWRSVVPKAVHSISGGTASGGVLEVRCGPLCTLAITRDHQLWCWGEGPQIEGLLNSKNKQAPSGARRKHEPGSCVTEPTRVLQFPDEYMAGLAVGATHAMVVVTRYPPEAQFDAKDEAGEEEEEQVEAIAKTTQEAVFWAGKFGYPVIIAPSEKVYRQWEGGQRGAEIDAGIRRCFTELQLRKEFTELFVNEEQRLRTAVSKAPRLMLAKMESEEMEMTAEELKKRDIETKKAQIELEGQRMEEQEKTRKRQQQIAEVTRRLAEAGGSQEEGS
jgi:alpha-tubulin suppressor-like RCC1 family protein